MNEAMPPYPNSTQNLSVAPEGTEYASEFKESLQRDIFGVHEAYLNDELHLGPVYHTETSGHEVVTIFTLSTDHVPSHYSSAVRTYLLIAANEHGQPLGYRITRILNEGGSLFANGKIEVGIKNKGYGMCLEMANADILQRDANKRSTAVTWYIEDQNYARVLGLAEKYKGIESDPDDLRSAKEEHERWKSIYATFHGTQCEDAPLIKVPFSPHEQVVDSEMVTDVSLSRDARALYGFLVAHKAHYSSHEQRQREANQLLLTLTHVASADS